MRPMNKIRFTTFTAAIVFNIFSGCSKEHIINTDNTQFVLTSTEIAQDSLLPVAYTCDGESSTLPLDWSGYPEGTQGFALIMHHVAPTDIHWYWVVYNIPVSVNHLSINASGFGTFGNNSVNGMTRYAPPCSQGPGFKYYVYTVYALSGPVELSLSASEVTREVLLSAIKNITLSDASLTVKYARTL